jgi:GrpB-like predicted nucleotidyltransferase (UPF0157 family)
MKEVVICAYDVVWQREFIRLCVHLTGFLQNDCLVIRHVGSTSVCGLDAKSVLDIDIVMNSPDDLEKVRLNLENRGYTFRGDLGIEGRFAFGYGSSSFMRHHLYVVNPQADAYLDHIALRDALKADFGAMDSYARVKHTLASTFPYDMDAYIQGKSDIIKAIMASEAGEKARRYNRQPHHKEIMDENRIRLKTTGDFPGEILFTLVPFEMVSISGSALTQEHLIGFAGEISLGYKKPSHDG